MGKTSVIMTHGGIFVDVLHPDSALVDICDIAHALSQINRFTGHTSIPYSVADHCLLASYMGIGDPLVCLLHDSAEAYLGDVASPLKKQTLIDLGSHTITYETLEQLHLVSIGEALGCPGISKITKESEEKLVDRVLLVAEAQIFLGADAQMREWRSYFDVSQILVETATRSLKRRIEREVTPNGAKTEYLFRYAQLKEGQG